MAAIDEPGKAFRGEPPGLSKPGEEAFDLSEKLGGLDSVVFLAGTGRSGTTWLGKLLDSSADVFYKHEPDHQGFFPWFRSIPSRIDPADSDPELAGRFSRAVGESFWHYSAFLHKRPDFGKSFFRPGLWTSLTRASRVLQKIGGRTPLVRLPRWAFRGDPAAVPLVIKTVVSNLRLAWIHRHFPAARFVLILRHPGGYLHSMIEAHEKHGWERYGTLERLSKTVLPFPLPEHERYADLFQNGSDFERELVYWIVANETPFLELGPTGSLLPVVYEELCERPMEVVERILAFLGLSAGESTRAFVRASTSADRSDFYGVYKDPRKAAWKWRDGLAAGQQERVEELLAGSRLAELWDSVSAPAVAEPSDRTAGRMPGHAAGG